MNYETVAAAYRDLEQTSARLALIDLWFEPGLVVEVLGAELTLSPTHTAATTVQEVVDLYRAARPTPTGS